MTKAAFRLYSKEMGRNCIHCHGGRYFLSADLELTFQRQFTDGMWDGPEPVTDYETTDLDWQQEIDLIKQELLRFA